MASTSSSSTFVAPRRHSMYDVFLSFRGEDTRNSFTDHLYKALVGAGLSIFRDNDEIGRGQQLKPEIERAITESKASIVVLTENYANSRWCLEELWLILEQRRNVGHIVLPVFYHVDPSDIRNHRKSFAIEGSKWTEYNVNRWKDSLAEIANLTGMVVSGPETKFITEIVDTVVLKLDRKLVSIPSHLTGMETRAEGISSWLKDEQSSADVLAICGMGGIGKTTLAQYIYNSNKQNFDSCSFLQDIGIHCQQPFGLLGLQIQLLTDIKGGKNNILSSVSEGTRKIEEVLQMKRVLIVLDDIDEFDELSALLGTKTFHTQSKIIITTRLLDVHAWFGSISWRCQIDELKLLNKHESLELFSCHAFGSKSPMEGFEELAIQFAQYCEGNPLALKVLGSSLFVSAEDPQNRNSIIEIWTSTLNSLNSLKGDLDYKIRSLLKKSFDNLPHASHKELFLHIAIFFVGEYKDYVVKILEQDWYAKSGIVTLVNRCLLTVSSSNQLRMHQLLQEMGRTIVREESKDPRKRSRVWLDDESYRVLGKGDVSETIEGLALDMGKLKSGTKAIVLKADSLAKMDKLKLLQLKYVELTGSYKKFPELIWLRWHGFTLKTLPAGLLMSSLVAIDMSFGKLEKFEPPMVLNSLKVLDFNACDKLVSIGNLNRLPALETLFLSDCSSLTYVCKSIEALESLEQLNLTGCKKLWKTSSNKKYANQLERLKYLCIGGGIPEQPLFSFPNSLKNLNLDYCDLEYNSDIYVVSSSQSLAYIGLAGNLFEFLPDNIDLKSLVVLDLTSCPKLKSLLCLPSRLQVLYAHWCISLEKITFESGRYRLREFGYEGCYKLSEIQGRFRLVSISKLDEADLGHMKWIKQYEDHTVDLVGDEITKGRIWHIQMMYEYGIRSIYLQGIQDESMKSEFISSSAFLSFRVPLCPKNRRIQGLNVSSLYRSSGEDEDMWLLFVKISNTTKGLTWIYNPVIYCNPKGDEDVVWLSYWPIGDILDSGDEINVSISLGNALMVSGCGASIVYIDGEIERENFENYTKEEEVIGGDLSDMELTTGVYYLCHRDFFNSAIPDWFKMLLGNTNLVTKFEEWRKSHRSYDLDETFMELEISRETLCKNIVLGVTFNSETEMCEIKKVLSGLVGVKYVSADINIGRLFVNGYVDLEVVVTSLKEFEKTVEIVSVDHR